MAFQKVPGRGSKNANLAFIGESPAANEFEQGRPFVGQSGQLLSNLLSHNLIPESEVYIDNVIQTKTQYRNPTFDEIKQAIPDLRNRLRALPRLNCIVAVGGVALQALSIFQYREILKYRGSILPARLVGRKMVPIIHPAFIAKDGFHEYRYFHVSISDIARAKEQSTFPSLHRPARTHEIIYQFDEAVERLRSLRDHEYWSFDLETSLPCLGFATGERESFTIPFSSPKNPSLWPARQKDFLIEEVRKAFNKEAKILTQYGFFDKRVLWQDYGIDPQSWDIYADTGYFHQLLYPELPHSLAFLASIYTEEPFYKDEGREWRRGDPEEPYFRYNGKDCCVTFETFFQLLHEAKEIGQDSYFFQVIMPAFKVLWRMHQNGVWVDQAELAKVRSELNREILINQIKNLRALGFEVNPRSPIQMETFLKHIKVKEADIVRSEKTGKVKANEDYLQRLAAKYPNKEILGLLAQRNAQHLQSGFTSLDVDGSGRFRPVFKFGPKSGRLACSGDDRGPQLQNIPPRLRRIYSAPRGRRLVAIDLDQADTRCLAYYAPEPMLIALFESEDPDIHSQVCHEVIIPHVPREEIFKGGPYDKQRKIAKEVGHGTNYGMGPRRLVTTLRAGGIFIKEGEARQFQFAYFNRFSNIKGFHLFVQNEVRTKRYLVDLNGRRHLLLGALDDKTFGEAYSRVPQGSVAGVMLRGMIRLQAEFDERYWNNEPLILMQIHDELVCECDTADVPLVAKLMNNCFSIPLSANGREFTIPMTTSVGEKWGQLQPYHGEKDG